MSTWRIEQIGKKPKLHNPVFLEGLPGIGNVGKVAIDFIVDELKAEKLYEITSNTFPHSVFVKEDNLIELPKVEIFYKKLAGNDLLILGGDVQPIDEISSYDFSEKILDIVSEFDVKEIITLGGIGLGEIPKKPKVYCTGNSLDLIKKYKDKNVQDKLYGVVGPIVGVSGLLLGLAARRKIKAVALLAETYGHPMYLGVKGVREILKVLNSKLHLGIKVDKLEKEIDYIEKQIIKRKEELSNVPQEGALKRTKKGETSYIG
ncbi:MAG: PAC2 family protein [Nanoarchaeota archaeon]|nr:PAC2 family protein [Nanoarchaeota archaeon]MBU1004529.1 PAC2 family protein [Nanoarchaeota archaeon]MBU1945934.1 PAC2 family protein [Nanoarchaeota archaeon]